MCSSSSSSEYGVHVVVGSGNTVLYTITMIDISIYRFRVGVHNANANARYLKRFKKSGTKPSCTGSIIFDQYNGYISSRILAYLFYVLFVIYIFGTALLIEVSLISRSCPILSQNFLSEKPSFAFIYSKLFLIYFYVHILNIYYSRNYCFNGVLQFCCRCSYRNILIGGRIGKGLSVIVVWLFSLNLMS